MELIENVLTVAWALRWWIVAVAFTLLVLAYVESVRACRRLRGRVAKLETSNRILIAHNRTLAAARRRRPIIAGRVVNQ